MNAIRSRGAVCRATKTSSVVLLCAGLAIALMLSIPVTSWAAGDANQASCPQATEESPGFRTYLPDCRAYELVTPSYTQSTPEAPSPAIGIASSGESVIVQSYGVFAGAQHNSGLSGTGYELSRKATGWYPDPLAPPADLFGSEFKDEIFVPTPVTGSGTSLWSFISGPTAATSLYLRGPDGTFGEIGPLGFEGQNRNRLKFGRAIGASPSLDDVLVSGHAARDGVEGVLWPGDTTSAEGGAPSLYEYEGENMDPAAGEREPQLVGVRNVGRLHGTPHVNEGAELVSSCGTELGGRSSLYNAVAESDEGVSVFFTALHNESCSASQPAVNELWLRENGERSTDLSEPAGPPGRCAPGEPCESAPVAGAEFRGASSDGRLVFFTSEQPLVSGAPAEGTKLYVERVAGGEVVEIIDASAPTQAAPPAVSQGVMGVARISEDGSRVYFVSEAALTGSNPEGGEPAGGEPNLYCFDTGTHELTFVTTLRFGDFADWEEDQRPVQTSPDGRFLAFASKASIAGARGGVRQIFEYDAQTATLVHVSRFQNGFEGIRGPEYSAFLPSPEFVVSPTVPTNNLAVSDDGAVAFQSSAQLTPGALNHQQVGESEEVQIFAQNVYVYDQGNVFLISDGEDLSLQPTRFPKPERAGAELVGLDSAGINIFFRTADALTSEQKDSQLNLYDARVDGGFPAEAKVEGCKGESCQPIGDGSSAIGVPATEAPLLAGNESSPRADQGSGNNRRKRRPTCHKQSGHGSHRKKCVATKHSSRPAKAKRG